MYKEVNYSYTRFSADILRKSLDVFVDSFDLELGDLSYILRVTIGEVKWGHDSLEEFLSDYRKATGYCAFKIYTSRRDAKLDVVLSLGKNTAITVSGPDRQKIESVFEVFERNFDSSRLPPPPKPTTPRPRIFIGHGHSPLWRDLKDHLHEQHAYEVEAYEIGARSGHTIRDILESMLKQGTFAILVMTGEDLTADNLLMPRLNVVHELGLFQGHLGFSKAIVLLEEGTQEFSNIHGTHQIRFAKGNIKETFGDVLATLRREFPEQSN